MTNVKLFEKAIFIQDQLLDYFKLNEHQGIDWSSVKYSKKYLSLIDSNNSLLKRIKSSVIARSFNFFGHHLLFLFEPIEKKYFTKAICLYLKSKINIEGKLDEDDKMLLDLLKAKAIPNSSLYAHEVPYEILGSKVTEHTPNLVTSFFVADLYFALHTLYPDAGYEELFKKIVDELMIVIPYFQKSESEICFQYTPISNYNVHNANLLLCELLVKYIYLFKDYNQVYQGLIEKSLNYSINDFRNSGHYFYSGPETRNTVVDNYHTGYVLRSLQQIDKFGQNLTFFELGKEIDRLFIFYKNTFVDYGKYVYKFKRKTIESHSLAEAILVFSLFKDRMNVDEQRNYAKRILYSVELLYDVRNGRFHNKCSTILGFPTKLDKMDYIRWSQAWMLLGISTFLNSEQE